MEDICVTHGDLVLSLRGKLPYKDETEMGNEAVQGVGEPNSTLTIEQQKR